MSCIVAIDAGTTGIRSRAVFTDGRPPVASYQEFTQHFPRPGWVEHDPADIWRAVSETLHDVVERVGAGEVAAIGITNQRETAVAWDRSTGRPYGNAIVWQDRRTAARCDELAAAGVLPLVRQRTGLVLDPYFTGTKWEWLLGPGGVPSGDDLALGTVDSWVIWNLTGGEVHATDATNASRTMLFDIHQLAWDAELCDLLHVPGAGPARHRGVERPGGSHLRPLRRAAGHPDQRHRGRSAGGPLRTGLPPSRHGQEHVRHGELRAAQRRRRVSSADGRPADDGGLDVGRRIRRLRPGGCHLLDGLGSAVAARRPGGDLHRGADRAVGGHRRRQWRGLRGPGVHRPRFAMVGPLLREGRSSASHGGPRPPIWRGRSSTRWPCRPATSWRPWSAPAGHLSVSCASTAGHRRWTCSCRSRPTNSASRCCVRGTRRRRPSERRSWPASPRGCCRDVADVEAHWTLESSFTPRPDRQAADATHVTWLRAVERSRGWART